MEYIKLKPRNFKKVTNVEGLEHVFKKYVNIHKLFLKAGDIDSPIEVIEFNEDMTLLIQLNAMISDEHAKLYTLLTRYLEFDASIIERMESNGHGNKYVLRINSCHIAQEGRENERFDSLRWDLTVGHITVLKVVENPASIMRSVSSQLFFKECEKELEDYAYRKVLFYNDKDLPVEVKYAVDTGKPLYIKNFEDTTSFFAEDPDYFKKHTDVKEEIVKRFQQMKENYTSMIVRPINYITIDERKFPIGIISVASSDRLLGQEDIERIESDADITYKKIRDANQVVDETRVKVLDISLGGLKIEVTDERLAKTLSTQDFVLFSLIFKMQQPIRLSGNVCYVAKAGTKSFHVGIAFKGSDFGHKAKSIINAHIEKSMKENPVG